MVLPPILDMTAGSRMMWFDKDNKNTLFVDKRQMFEELASGHLIDVNPDVIADWTDGLPFPDESFHLVVFDPPHLINAGANSWLAKKYGVLDELSWPFIIRDGFDEAMRVLKPFGTLVFKWNDSQINLPELLAEIQYQPLFGQKREKTHWLVFMKMGINTMNRIKELREKRNLTLRELGKEVGISFGALGNYENGKREPKLKTWGQLADYFNVPIPYIQGVSDVRHGGDVNSVDAKAIQLEIDHGVKLQIPIDVYNNTDMFEINHNADGTETLTIKNVEHVTNQFK